MNRLKKDKVQKNKKATDKSGPLYIFLPLAIILILLGLYIDRTRETAQSVSRGGKFHETIHHVSLTGLHIFLLGVALLIFALSFLRKRKKVN